MYSMEPSGNKKNRSVGCRYHIPGGDADCHTENGIMGRTGQCGRFGLLFHYLCKILRPHTVHFLTVDSRLLSAIHCKTIKKIIEGGRLSIASESSSLGLRLSGCKQAIKTRQQVQMMYKAKASSVSRCPAKRSQTPTLLDD